jgi:hypothetical protein
MEEKPGCAHRSDFTTTVVPLVIFNVKLHDICHKTAEVICGRGASKGSCHVDSTPAPTITVGVNPHVTHTDAIN